MYLIQKEHITLRRLITHWVEIVFSPILPQGNSSGGTPGSESATCSGHHSGILPRSHLHHRLKFTDSGTSLTLNIAEGNGRFSAPDHRKFIDIAEESVTKLSVCPDVVEVICPLVRIGVKFRQKRLIVNAL